MDSSTVPCSPSPKSKVKPFSVVNFVSENRFCVVPTTWISEDQSKCAWPNKSTKKASKLFACPDSLPEDNWRWFDVTIIKTYDTYEKAFKKSEGLRRNNSIPDSSDGEQLLYSSLATVDKYTAEPPNSRTQLPNSFLDISGETDGNHSQVQLTSTIGNEDVTALDDSENVHGYSTAIQLLADPGLTELKEEFHKFQGVTLENQAKILAELHDLKNLLRQVLNRDSSNVDPHAYPTLPLQSLDELMRTEKSIADDAHQFAALVREMKRVGGNSIMKNVNNALRRIISRDLAKTIRFTDNSGKTPFGELKLADAVRVSIEEVWGEPASSTVVNDYMAKHFRNTVKSKVKPTNGDAKKNQESANSSSSAAVLASNTEHGNDSDE